MQAFSESDTLRQALQEQRAAGRRIALVPTMGNLHGGHLALVEQARQAADFVVTSIFVNPLQFGPGEDLDAYPRSLESDRKLLADHGCDALFLPEVAEMYGDDLATQTRVQVPGISENYCGRSRPGHFDGVATVVSKLFNIVAPDVAFFGLKDYQQFLVIKKMVSDLKMPIHIKGVEIVRADNGLALSSRNNYLSEAEKLQATAIYRTLCATRDAILAGRSDFSELEAAASQALLEAGLRPDYFAICRAADLRPAEPADQALAILAAAWLGRSRLIDNLRFSRHRQTQ